MIKMSSYNCNEYNKQSISKINKKFNLNMKN